MPWAASCPVDVTSERLVDTKPSQSWTPLHQSMLRCCVAGGQWPAERLHGAGLIENPECFLCGRKGTSFHRGYQCPGGHEFRYNYGLIDGTIAAAKQTEDNQLWTRAVVPDSMHRLPPPSFDGPEWSVKPQDGSLQFTGHGFGDGSGVSPFGPKSTRCGYSVVQVEMKRGAYQLRCCLLGPLPGPIQATPASEATALLHYLMNAIDKAGMVFFSDCQWVVDSHESGPTSCTGAAHVHADIWRKVHALNDGRKYQIRVEKVNAHATESDLAQGYPRWYKEGNAYADAGAKVGRTKHPRNQIEEKHIAKAFVLLQMLG